MLDQMIEKAKKAAEKTGNHVDYELDQLVKQMGVEEIANFAIEDNWSRLAKLNDKHVAGDYRKTYTEAQNLAANQRMVFKNIRSRMNQ